MTAVRQPEGLRGSLKWIQRAVNNRPETLDGAILPHLAEARRIEWRSPLVSKGYEEYRDAAFLDALGVGDLAQALAGFWPRRGPQRDALARSDDDDLLLVEAKAHIWEMFSPATQASPASLATIERALTATAEQAGAKPKAAWSQCFFQYANRLAHLHFLRSHGKKAWLVLVSFVGDTEMGGPETVEGWRTAYAVMDHVLGLDADHRLARYVIHIHPHVADLA